MDQLKKDFKRAAKFLFGRQADEEGVVISRKKCEFGTMLEIRQYSKEELMKIYQQMYRNKK